MIQGVQNESMPCDWQEAFKDLDDYYLAFLWGSYGRNNRCLTTFLTSNSYNYLTVYLSQGVCERKKNCSSIEAQTYNEISEALREAREYFTQFNNVSVRYVLKLEDNYSALEAELLAAQIKANYDIELWRNPNNKSELNPVTFFDGIELHNDTIDAAEFPITYSNDGKCPLLANYNFSGLFIGLDEIRRIRRSLGRNTYFLLWHPVGNCLHGDTLHAPYPINRDCSQNTQVYKELNSFLKDLK